MRNLQSGRAEAAVDYRTSPVQKFPMSQLHPAMGGAPLTPPVQAYPPVLLILQGCPVFGQVSASALGRNASNVNAAPIAAIASP
jgi:hypothetical protein